MTKTRRKTRAKIKERHSVTMQPCPWDMGASGPANRRGLVMEDAMDADPETGRVINPNGVKRVRRVDILEVWHRKGVISTAGFNAAEKLRDAFEATGRAPGWPEIERVDSSPKPDHAVTIQIDRMSAFHAYHRHVAAEDREIIDVCVLRSGTPASIRRYRYHGYPAGLAHLRAALDRLAAAMG